MKTCIKKYKWLILLFVLFGYPCSSIGILGNPRVIFSNYDLNNTIFMDRIAIQRIFTRQDTRWFNGNNISVFIKPMDSIEHRKFVTDILHMSLYRYQQNLEIYTYTARAVPVTEVNSDAKMRIAIRTHPGAIGYINYELYANEKQIVICDEYNDCPQN